MDLQNPPVASPESNLVPGMSAPEPAPLLTPTQNTTGGFPNIPDSSVPGLQALQEPPGWVYDFDPANGTARATFLGEVNFTTGGSATAGVTSFNTRTGAVTLTAADVTGVGAIVNPSPALAGTPTAPTAGPGTSTTQIATTAFVGQAIANASGVVTFNGRNGAVTLTAGDITTAGGAPSVSPAFTGTPTAPTQSVADNSSNLATTAYVNNWGAANAVLSFNGRRGAVSLTLADITTVGGAPLASPNFTGTPAGTTAAPGTSTTQLATTAFVTAAVSSATVGVSSFNTRTGAVTLALGDITGAGGAPAANAALTGVPTAPTATGGTNTSQIATTAFVQTAITSMSPVVTTFNGRAGAVTLTLVDVTSVGGAPLANPTFTGTAAAPTPTAGDNSTNIATTAFVQTAAAGVAMPPGSVVSYAGSVAPSGWLLCDGSAVSRTGATAALFAAIGTTYGTGNGTTTFNLPDLRGRVVAGLDGGTGRLTPTVANTLGAVGGAQTYALAIGDLAAHNHTVNDPQHSHSITDPGHFHSISGNILNVRGVGSVVSNWTGGSQNVWEYTQTNNANTGITSTNGVATGITTANNGSGNAHLNTQPTMALNKIIKT